MCATVAIRVQRAGSENGGPAVGEVTEVAPVVFTREMTARGDVHFVIA